MRGKKEPSGPISADELMNAQFFHGHKCPAMPQGLRAGHLAMDLLGVERARGGGELQAIVEIGDHHFSGCFADGVQFATGCTFGKGNIRKEPLGKFALTLVDTKTSRAVRVSARYERMSQCLAMPFFTERQRGVPPFALDPEVVEPLIADVMTRPWPDLFTVATFEQYPVPSVAEAFTALQCTDCGEMVVTPYAHELDGHPYCATCFGARAFRGRSEPQPEHPR